MQRLLRLLISRQSARQHYLKTLRMCSFHVSAMFHKTSFDTNTTPPPSSPMNKNLRKNTVQRSHDESKSLAKAVASKK
jgi:hypothetical protein